MAATLIMSSTTAPRDRSLHGRRRPCTIGPTALAPANRCTSLYAMFPASSEGNTRTFARPATGLSGAFRAATTLASAASPCNSPSTASWGILARTSATASRTRSTDGPSALSFVLKLRKATTGSSPTIRRRSPAAAIGDVSQLRRRRIAHDGAVGEGQHLRRRRSPEGRHDHVEGARHGATAIFRTDEPQAGANDFAGGVDRAGDAAIRHARLPRARRRNTAMSRAVRLHRRVSTAGRAGWRGTVRRPPSPSDGRADRRSRRQGGERRRVSPGNRGSSTAIGSTIRRLFSSTIAVRVRSSAVSGKTMRRTRDAARVCTSDRNVILRRSSRASRRRPADAPASSRRHRIARLREPGWR